MQSVVFNVLAGNFDLIEKDGYLVFEQEDPLQVWLVEHNMGKRPSVTTTSLAGKRVNGSVTYLSDNTLQIEWSAPFSGRAYLN